MSLMSRKVLICTPAHDGRVEVEYCHSLLHTARLLMREGIVMRESFLINCTLIQDIRNAFIKLAIDGNFDDLIFIDADQDWQAEWVLCLLNHPVDCVGLPVVKRTDDFESYNVVHSSFAIPFDPTTGLLRVDGIGTGFLRLSKRALKVLWDTSEAYTIPQMGEGRWVFDYRPVNGGLRGEDTLLCRKLTQHGIAVYVDPSVTCGHIGRKHYKGDFAAWLRRCQVANAKKEAAE